MGSKVFVLVALVALLTGCGQDENSPTMGAVPPKPDPSKLPPQMQGQLKNAGDGAANAAPLKAPSKSGS